jgi:hypothetical protein
MKFYSTLLIAFVLFGLCLIERRAKENNAQKELNNRKNDDGLESGYAGKAFRYGSGFSALAADLESNASDSTGSQSLNSGKSLLNISLNSHFVSNP